MNEEPQKSKYSPIVLNLCPSSEKEEPCEADCDNCHHPLYRHQDSQMNEGHCKMCNCVKFTYTPPQPQKYKSFKCDFCHGRGWKVDPLITCPKCNGYGWAKPLSPTPKQLSECSQSKRVDGKFHSWVFDGDDPYVICHYCGERRDALTDQKIPDQPPESPKPAKLSECCNQKKVWHCPMHLCSGKASGKI